jgi:hypothetical protein
MDGDTPGDRVNKAALNRALKAMFNRLRARPVPDRLMSVVEQLDAAPAAERKKAGG